MKNKFLTSTIVLIVGGALTKILGMIIRIIMTRIVGSDGISLYMLVFPTFALFMTISQLGFPLAISKIISEETHNNKSVVFSIIPFSLIFNLILMIIIFITAPFISNKLLNDPRCYYPILAIALVLPFDSLSSILRGYFFGKQRMIPHVISNIFEQIVRLILIVVLVPKIIDKSIILAVSILVGINMISELSSILILFLFMPYNFKIKKEDIKPDISNVKNILRIAIPNTGSRLIGSIGYFFEPVLLILSQRIINLNSLNITTEYGIIAGYIMPIMLLPSFFTNAIGSALLPVLSRAYSKKNIKYLKKKIKQSLVLSFIIGFISIFSLMISPTFFLKFIYNTTKGSNYIILLGPFFILYYIESTLVTALQAINKSNLIMIDSIISIIIKSIILFVGSILYGIYGFILSVCINIVLLVILYLKQLKNALK